VDNEIGVIGVAPGVDIYALKVLDASGSGNFSNIIAALNWCVLNGIKVTNNSYGSSVDPGITVQEAFNNSYAKGILHIASAGNSGKAEWQRR
jgi:subtilisin